jgi:hypothetical protein
MDKKTVPQVRKRLLEIANELQAIRSQTAIAYGDEIRYLAQSLEGEKSSKETSCLKY